MNRHKYASKEYLKPELFFCNKCGNYGHKRHNCEPVRIDEHGQLWEFVGRMPGRTDVPVMPLQD